MSLLDGPFPIALEVAALGCLAALLVRRRAGWWRVWVPLAAGGALLLVGVLGAVLDVPTLVNDTFPASFYVWVAAPVFALFLLAFGWRGSGSLRRVAGVLAVPLLAALAANTINQFYAYEPTVGALFNASLPDEVSADQLQAELAAASATTGASHVVSSAGTTPTGRPASTTTTTLDPEFGSSGPVATLPSAPPPITVTGSIPARGQISTIDIPATVSGFAHRPAMVWLPPAWFATPRPELPVLVMVAGVPGQPANWLRAADAGVTAQAWADAHGGVAPILVFPDQNGSFTGDTECVDGVRGNADTYLSVDVPAFVKSTLGGSPDPRRWGIVGLSEGGTCALMQALRHPDVYPHFVDLSGDLGPNVGNQEATIKALWGGDPSKWAEYDPMTLLSQRRYPRSTGWFASGLADPKKLADIRQLAAAARGAGMLVEEVAPPGGHDFRFWTQAFKGAMPWIAAQVGVG